MASYGATDRGPKELISLYFFKKRIHSILPCNSCWIRFVFVVQWLKTTSISFFLLYNQPHIAHHQQFSQSHFFLTFQPAVLLSLLYKILFR